MASRVEDNLQCPACLEIFKDPVGLPCSHSFCRACVQKWCKAKGNRTCPVCRTEFNSMELPLNLALRNVCEAFSQASVESDDICSLHKEKMKLFCVDHQKLVCHICKDAKIHTGHKFRPLDEVHKDHQDKLQGGLQEAKQRLEDYIETRDNCNEQATYIKVQRQQVESKIKKDFEELCRFLQAEEEARLSAVREEEEEKTRMMKEKIASLSRDMVAVSDVIRSTEELLTSDPISFLKNFQTAMTRIQKLPDGPKLLPGALLDEVKHVGNLKFSVWERMKETISYSPVILDPNTAGPKLILSEDLTSVSCQEVQQRPNNPERFKWERVLGSALASGTNIWDVEVGDNNDWSLGVVYGDPCLPNYMTIRSIAFRNDKYRKFGEQFGSWNPPVKLQRIQVHVDMNKRLISFYESRTNTELCKKNPFKWPRLFDNMKMFPYFVTRDKIPLQIIPLACRVSTQSPHFVGQDRQDGLQEAKKRLKDYIETRENCNEQAMYIKVQSEQVESKINKDFEELRRVLLAEEEARLSAVREEEEEKARMMKEKIETLSRDMAALSDVIRSTEELLTSDPISFLKNFQTAMTRIQKLPDGPKLLPGALLDEVKHVGNLKFSVWERMKETISYSPIILDPNTAGPKLSLSEDLTSVSCQEEQQRPNNPERFKWERVLGSALASGTHMWVVEVGDNRRWALGVVWGNPCSSHDMKVWSIVFCDDKYRKFGEPFGSWNPPVPLQRFRVHVDMNKRTMSFSISRTNTELCETDPSDWPNLSDNMKMFPYFGTYDKIPLQIIPLDLIEHSNK
ncbi:E3 ubiquitin-protein ligase TRIM39-like [Festucalex cinctus]